EVRPTVTPSFTEGPRGGGGVDAAVCQASGLASLPIPGVASFDPRLPGRRGSGGSRVRRSRASEPSARMWAFCMVGLNLAGAVWLAIHMAVIEHDAAAGIAIALLALAIVVGHMRAARAADAVRARRLVRHGK